MFVYVGGESDQWVSDALKEAKNKIYRNDRPLSQPTPDKVHIMV